MNKTSFKRYTDIINDTMSKIKAIREPGVDNPELKRLFKRYLIANRFLIRKIMNEISSFEALNRLTKQVKKSTETMEEIHEFSALECKHKKQLDKLDDALVIIGENILSALDYWQVYGAGLPELFELCGVDISIFSKVNPYDTLQHFTFGVVVYAYDLDYRSTRPFIESNVDGPFTHAIRAYKRSITGKAGYKYFTVIDYMKIKDWRK